MSHFMRQQLEPTARGSGLRQ